MLFVYFIVVQIALYKIAKEDEREEEKGEESACEKVKRSKRMQRKTTEEKLETEEEKIPFR